jgi:putative restriction endonuclease
MAVVTDLLDARVRVAAFRWLEEQTRVHGEVLPWGLLLAGFVFDGRRVPLVSQQGIFKPQVLPELPLAIRTSVGGPYDDALGRDELLLYAYRGADPQHPDNRRLREAMRRRVPLVYLFGLLAGRYLPVWPVLVVGDDPGGLHCTVAADDSRLARLTQADSLPSGVSYSAEGELRRRYVTREVRQRLHQQEFRVRVLEAYRRQCALCRLRHPELLDAAHIIPDAEERGVPVVRNGLSLCRLHLGAYDSYLLAVRPDYTVEVSRSVLAESDGPMLRHGLQAMHGVCILTPRAPEKRPDRDLLQQRLRRFREAG